MVICNFCYKEFNRKDALKKHLIDRSCKMKINLFELHENLNNFHNKILSIYKLPKPQVKPQVHEEHIQEHTQEFIQENDDNLLVKTFEEHNITIYGTFDKPLFKAKDIGDLLDIVNIRESVKDFTDKQKDVVSLNDTIGRKQDTIMLTEQGLYKVIVRSRKPIAIQFQDWICEVMEEIRKTREFKIKINKSNELFIQQYNGKPVNYIGTVQEKDDIIIKKYGQTTGNLYQRLKSHQKQYGNNFHFTNIIECDNIQELEKRIQTHGILKDRHIKNYDGKVTQELIQLDDKLTEIDLMKIIYEIKDTIDNSLQFKLEQEKTKQKELELEIKKMEFEMMKLK